MSLRQQQLGRRQQWQVDMPGTRRACTAFLVPWYYAAMILYSRATSLAAQIALRVTDASRDVTRRDLYGLLEALRDTCITTHTLLTAARNTPLFTPVSTAVNRVCFAFLLDEHRLFDDILALGDTLRPFFTSPAAFKSYVALVARAIRYLVLISENDGTATDTSWAMLAHTIDGLSTLPRDE